MKESISTSSNIINKKDRNTKNYKNVITKSTISLMISFGLLQGCVEENPTSSPTPSIIESFLNNLFALKDDYYSKTETSMPLEAKYTKFGSYSVLSKDFQANEKSYQKYKVWYPSELETSTKQYPVVIFVNGSGTPYSQYEPVLKHLASWGFIAIGNDDKTSWTGYSTSQSLELLLKQNNDKNSIFYQKINSSQVGLSGHSQGGVGIINAVTNFENGKSYRSIYGSSTTKHALAVYLEWSYDVSKITIPYFMVAAMGQVDAGDGKDEKSGIAPLWSIIENYDKLPQSTPAVRARRKNADHSQMLYIPDGYMTAWFLYTLTNDNEAKQIFSGDSSELKQNSNWEDIAIKNLP